MGVNKVILIGNLGKKPEIRYTSSGIPVANFSVATTERFGKDEAGERKEHTEWHRCVAWRKLAEICGQYLDKGTKVYLEGRIRRGEFTGQDGVKRYSFEIHIDNMEILSPKGTRDFVPDEPAYAEFPGSAPASRKSEAVAGKSLPSPPDNEVDLEPDIDLEEDDDDFLTN
jgi:single-strand DNA-binding protein